MAGNRDSDTTRNNQGKNRSENTSENHNFDARADSKPLTFDLNNNINTLKQIFCYPVNQDFVIREIHIKAINRAGALCFLQGMADVDRLEKQVILPLLEDSIDGKINEDIITDLMKRVLTDRRVNRTKDFKDITKNIINGNTVLLIQGLNIGIKLATVGYEHRAIEKPSIENTLKGPKESFIESELTNRSLIRKYVRDEKLITESIDLGGMGVNEVLMMYIADIANEDLVQDVKERVKQIEVDKIQSISILEQHIEERPYSLIPTVLSTERPDRAAAFLNEGHIALLMEGSPSVLIVPITFWSLFHNPEDQYQRWAYGNFIRIIRLICCFIALLTPGIFLAITSFHVDMIPTDLVLAIASSREVLPFPAFMEVLIMEISFELLREAGVRIPTPIGPTIGIVGALILGQAAVEANIVSLILVIIVAITGLASFAIPEISLSFMIRIGRFLFLIAGTVMGFYGIAVLFTLCLGYLSTIKSFGVYFMSPYAPGYPSSKDLVMRPQVWKQWLRPLNLIPKRAVRKKKV